MADTLIIIPTYNEKENITEVIKKVLYQLDKGVNYPAVV